VDLSKLRQRRVVKSLNFGLVGYVADGGDHVGTDRAELSRNGLNLGFVCREDKIGALVRKALGYAFSYTPACAGNNYSSLFESSHFFVRWFKNSLPKDLLKGRRVPLVENAWLCYGRGAKLDRLT